MCIPWSKTPRSAVSLPGLSDVKNMAYSCEIP